MSRAVYTEALDALFEVNSIRLWERNEWFAAVAYRLRWVDLVRNLELVNIVNHQRQPWCSGFNAIRHIVTSCPSLPRLKTITIDGDAHGQNFLGYLQAVHRVFDTNERPRCVNVGLFRPGDEKLAKVYLKHYGLNEAWRRVKAAADKQIDLVEALYEYVPEIPNNELEDWFENTDLVTWCTVYDRWRSGNHAEMSVDERDIVDIFQEYLKDVDADSSHPGLGVNMRLRDVDPKVHDAGLLEWLTMFLLRSQAEFPTIFEGLEI